MMLLRTTSRARALVTATIPRLARRTLHTKPRTLLGALPTPSAPNPAGLTRLHKLLLAASGLSLGVGASYLRRRNARKAGEDADAEPPRFTLAQVREHSKPDDAWIVIEGEVYDVSGFGPHHPGGAGVLAKYAGRDVTAEFRALKHSRHAEYMRQALRVGYLAEGEEEATKEVEAPAESDVLIVGAGICGLATAYFLSEREKGKRSITVIDEAPLVGGTALKSSAIMFLGPLVEVQEDDKEKKKKKKKTLTSYMCELSYEFLTRVQREWADVRFRDVPMMGLIENEEQLRRAEKMVARMRNGSVELVTDVARLRELEPELSDEAGAVLGAVLHRRAATVDPFLLCDALARRAQANGVRVVLGTRMADVARREGGGFEVHGARGERLGCEKLVLCTGWRVREHAALLGHDVPVAGMHGEMLALAPPTTDFALRHLVYGFEALVHWGKPGVEEKSTREAQPPFARKTNHLYGLQFSEGVLKFGGDRIRTWLDGQVLEDGVAATHAHVAKLFPKLAKAERIGQWSGMLPFTPDQKVVLGRLGEEEGVYAVTGSGVMKGVASGQLLARVVSGDTHGIEDVLAECDPGRFEGKEGEGVE